MQDAEDIDPYKLGRANDAPTWGFFVFWAHKKERQNDAPAWFILLQFLLSLLLLLFLWLFSRSSLSALVLRLR